jgi:hypothetical protein
MDMTPLVIELILGVNSLDGNAGEYAGLEFYGSACTSAVLIGIIATVIVNLIIIQKMYSRLSSSKLSGKTVSSSVSGR